jgi:hypothetical protein
MKIGRQALIFAILGVVLGSIAAAGAQQTNAALIADNPTTQTEIDRHKELTGEARAQTMASELQAHGMPAVVLEGELRHDLRTHSAKAGDAVLLALQKPAVLPGGMALPRGSLVEGHVVQTAAHSKSYKNGAMLVNFDMVRPKGGDETAIFALIATLMPSVDEMSVTEEIHHGTIGATSNSPNASIVMSGGMGDAVLGHDGQVSGIPGVLLVSSAGGSGVLVAPDDDVSMFAGQRMLVVVGLAGEDRTLARAHAVLHPAPAAATASSGQPTPAKH